VLSEEDDPAAAREVAFAATDDKVGFEERAEATAELERAEVRREAPSESCYWSDGPGCQHQRRSRVVKAGGERKRKTS
jgi:hypothetical protein